MEVNIRYQGRSKFLATARHHTILTDQPAENGGDDAGMTPPEWFLASLGSCIGFYAAKYLQARNQDATGLSVDVSAQKLAHPIRLDNFEVHLTLPRPLDEDYYEGLESAAEACVVHNTLLHPPQITTEITAGYLVADPEANLL